MNSDFAVVVKALMWKEIVESKRTLVQPILLSSIVVCIALYIPVAHMVTGTSSAKAQMGVILELQSRFIPLLSIPLLGNMILLRTIGYERRSTAIQVLLASGINPSWIWLVKLCLAFAASYLFNMAALAGYCVYVKGLLGVSVVLSPGVWVADLLALPAIGLGILSLASLGYWCFKTMEILGAIFPLAAMMIVWTLSGRYVFSGSIFLVGGVALTAGSLMTIASFLVVRAVSRERVAGPSQY